MIALLDTHAFLWAVLEDERLGVTAETIWRDTDNELFLSAASVWEVAIKVSLGKMSVDRPLDQFFDQHLQANQVELLPIRIVDAAKVVELPFHRRDPFDRLIVAQAIVLNMPVISADPKLDPYGVKRIW